MYINKDLRLWKGCERMPQQKQPAKAKTKQASSHALGRKHVIDRYHIFDTAS